MRTVLSIFLLSFCFNVNAVGSKEFKSLIKSGDNFYKKRENIKNVTDALSTFEQAKKLDPNSTDVLWRISMTAYYHGHRTDKKDTKTRKSFFERGVKAGKRCAEINEDIVECYFWWATNLILLKETNGIFSLAFGIGDVIALYETALKLDPKYASSGPYRMLALLHYKAPGFLGGDESKAYKYIQTAIKNSSNEPLNYYFYGQFLSDNGESQKAVKILQDFIKVAKPKDFLFYESRTAFKHLKHYIKYKKWIEL